MAARESSDNSTVVERGKGKGKGKGNDKAEQNRQHVKLLNSLKRISNLQLTDEKQLTVTNGCRWSSLTMIKNDKESSSTLVEVLCAYYNSDAKSFIFNDRIFSFCAHEVADVLGISINDTDMDLAWLVDQTKRFPAKFPEDLYRLRKDCLHIDRQKKFTQGHMKEMIKQMRVNEEEDKTLFLQLLSYYYMEQFFMCNTKYPRPTTWKYVCDMDAFNRVNWAREIHSHLMSSVSEMHQSLLRDKKRASQFEYKGCAPALEAIIFERIPALRPRQFEVVTPPVQKWTSHRGIIENWRTSLMGCKIEPCHYCTIPSSTLTPQSSPLIPPLGSRDVSRTRSHNPSQGLTRSICSDTFKKLFKNRVQSAQKDGTILVLHNLDPEYVSIDVEEIIWHSFKERCMAEVVHQTTIFAPLSGQAVVIFETREGTERIMRKLAEGCLMLPNGRPLVCSIPPTFSENQPAYYGHLVIDKKNRLQRETKDSVSTSHCSLPYTNEYNMAMEWFLLQLRSDGCWKRLYKRQGQEISKLMAKFKSK